ncbi:ribokinase [Oscillibacter sp.]|uniref:ribokinase n=1 Tax=Oscillibacter sp. TaxID=1945593 RepID=UPI002639F453|nr:ribokinase [Oscillibacter sp.]MDD3347441.1 ribokinase [Oscillibacter sp.]
MKKKIVVFGSFVVDLTARSPRLPMPGETVLGSAFSMGPGGKGSNQAVAAHRAGADVTLVTKVGQDVFGAVATDFYERERMDTRYVLKDAHHETGCALITVDEHSAQNEIVVISGACGCLTEGDVEKCRALIEGAGLLLVQLEVNFDALFRVIKIAHEAGVPIVLNPAPAKELPDEILRMIDVVTPNETEAQLLTGVEVKTEADARRAAEVFLSKGVKQVVITLGSMGAFAMDRERSELLPRLEVEAVDTTGAGDAFNGGFVTALSEGADLFTALRWGNVTGALSVTRLGTAPAMPRRAEIETLYQKVYG